MALSSPLLFVCCSLGINGALMVMAIKHNPVDTGMQAIVTGVMKTIDAALMLVLGYYFGSSADSSAKSQMLYESTPTGHTNETTGV